MLVRGIRGATTVSQNTKTDIVKETSTLLSEMISANEINTEDIASIIFTTTFDVTLEFPAVAAREILSLNTVPLLNMHEINNPDGITHLVTVYNQDWLLKELNSIGIETNIKYPKQGHIQKTLTFNA